MLSDSLKAQIQGAYSSILDKKGYSARYCQRRMIADIANTLGNVEADEEGTRVSDVGHVCVVEAGTGTGKTVAYAVAAIPLAKALGKRLVISTATVALQEQIVLRDLPDISRHSGLDFTFTLAKGRRRYLCLSRLDQVLQNDSSANRSLAFYDDEVFASNATDVELFETMLTRLGRGEWDGDRDNWPQEIEDRAWYRISTDHVQCTGRKCSHFQNCYFYKAREQVHKVDCVVTNHDLVLSDLMMGGGVVLPEPEETIYVFDEGHHLPDKAVNHFSNFVQARSTQSWLEGMPAVFIQLVGECGEIGSLPAGQRQLEAAATDVVAALDQLLGVLEPMREAAEPDAENARYRFPNGAVSPDIREAAGIVYESYRSLMMRVEPLVMALEDRMTDTGEAERETLERWLPVVSAISARLNGGAALWCDYMETDATGSPPRARWLVYREGEININASPVAVDQSLRELLWDRCHAAVVTSATLAVAGDFERFRRRAGISAGNTFNALPSPFRFEEQALLRVPLMSSDPRQADAHNDEVATLLPELLAGIKGGLVLFSSWRQMFRVSDLLDETFMDSVLRQGTFSKAEIVSRHKERVDSGESSVIFGLASFAEGIDLPGDYCDHVVVVKIPFAVPDDPVGATLSEWIDACGGNSFQEIMIPDAALRMHQACGRLLRTETDTGIISILDRRLVTQRYGSVLLAALPPFRREIA